MQNPFNLPKALSAYRVLKVMRIRFYLRERDQLLASAASDRATDASRTQKVSPWEKHASPFHLYKSARAFVISLVGKHSHMIVRTRSYIKRYFQSCAAQVSWVGVLARCVKVQSQRRALDHI